MNRDGWNAGLFIVQCPPECDCEQCIADREIIHTRSAVTVVELVGYAAIAAVIALVMYLGVQ